jgi:hypothetical protein
MNIFTQKKYILQSAILKYSFVALLAFALIAPTFAHAVFVPSCDQNDPTCQTPNTNTSSSSISSGGTTPSPTGSGGTLPSPTGSGGTTPSPTGSGGTLPSTNGVSLNTRIANPLGSNITDLPTFINVIVSFVLLIAIPIIVLAVIYAGFLFVTAQGNSEKLKKAKTTLLYTLIGAALLLGSFIIAKAIQGTVSQITS